ncbi:MAG: carbon monoxide dehydrogenase subunit G [Alphaproteobacteria bacterium]|nr:carbon monoxide dehydrogenase subunit G [Alphaproteobacteria bacterium]
MEMSASQLISAPKEAVWDGLNNPDILKACIPGCKDLTPTDDNGFEATVQAKVGPVKATFKGAVTLSDIDAPNGYTISGEGKGGAAGFAKGDAKVRLESTDDGTILHYEVNAKVGGKLAQIGSRLIDSTAKKMAGDFFEKFAEQLTPSTSNDSTAKSAEEKVNTIKTTEKQIVKEETSPKTSIKETDKTPTIDKVAGLHPFVWTVGLVGLMIALIFSFSG